MYARRGRNANSSCVSVLTAFNTAPYNGAKLSPQSSAEETLREKRLLSMLASAAAFAALLALLSPQLPIGSFLDRRGEAAAYAWRNPPRISSRITLIDIDDASIEALGSWPWDETTIRKLFEAPFYLAERTVSVVSPADFRDDLRAGEAYWRALSNLPSTSAAFPFETTGVPLEVLSALSERPAGAQGLLILSLIHISEPTRPY